MPIVRVIVLSLTVGIVGKVAKLKSPRMYCDVVPAPAMLIVPEVVIGEPVIVKALPVSVKATLVTLPPPVASATHDPPSPYFT